MVKYSHFYADREKEGEGDRGKEGEGDKGEGKDDHG